MVWGIGSEGHVACRNGPNGKWTPVDGKLKQVEIGKLGVFGVNSADDIFYRIGTKEDLTSVGTGWQR